MINTCHTSSMSCVIQISQGSAEGFKLRRGFYRSGRWGSAATAVVMRPRNLIASAPRAIVHKL